MEIDTREIKRSIFYSVPLSTERTIIRKYIPEDIDDYYRYTKEDREYLWGLDLLGIHSNINGIIKYAEDVGLNMFAIADKDNKFIGNIRFMVYKVDNEIEVEIQYYISKSARGNGLGTEIMKKAVDFISNILGINSIVLRINCGNKASLIAKKLGFKLCKVEIKNKNVVQTYRLEIRRVGNGKEYMGYRY